MLEKRLKEDMKSALRNKDKQRLEALRLILSEIKNESIQRGQSVLSEEDLMGVLIRLQKKRKAASENYENLGYPQKAKAEAFEASLIQSYVSVNLLSETELDQLINKVVSQFEHASIRDMKAILDKLRPMVQGRVDMSELSKKLKNRLTT